MTQAFFVFVGLELLASLVFAAVLLLLAYSDPAYASERGGTRSYTKDCEMEKRMSWLTPVQIEQAWRAAQAARDLRIQTEQSLVGLRRREREALENAQAIAACAADDALQSLQEALVEMED